MGVKIGIDFTTFKGSKTGQIVKATGHRELEDGQAIVRITHSGVCGTDEHLVHFDMALGHEGVGVIEKVAPDVTSVKVGDRVGFGYVHWTCGECMPCKNGQDQYCENRREYITHDQDQGSYGSHVVWYAKNLHVLPEGMESKYAGPLMCGGATVWGALTAYNVKPSDRVGIIGIGGLGHLGIQFAAAMGCEVVVFSSTESKREEAMKFGATEFHATKGVTKFEGIKKLNALLITTSEQPDFDLYFPILAAGSTLFPLTVDFGKTPIALLKLIVEGHNIQGSATATFSQQERMLQFAVAHNIRPQIMEWPMDTEGITTALKTLKEGHMRYRGVVVA